MPATGQVKTRIAYRILDPQLPFAHRRIRHPHQIKPKGPGIRIHFNRQQARLQTLQQTAVNPHHLDAKLRFDPPTTRHQAFKHPCFKHPGFCVFLPTLG